MVDENKVTVLAKENIYCVDIWPTKVYNATIKHFQEKSVNEAMGVHFHQYGMSCGATCFIVTKNQDND